MNKIDIVIYLTTNLVNNTIYIGKDKWNKNDYFGSGANYKRAERKYGKHNFKKEILCHCETNEEACFIEIDLIAYCKELQLRLYNITKGGEGRIAKHTKSAKIKMKGRKPWNTNKNKNTDKRLKKLSIRRKGKNNPFFGKNHSATTNLINSISKLGKKRPTSICKYCNKEFSDNTINRWHNNNCKFKIAA